MAHTGPRTSARMGEGESPFSRVVVVAVLYNLELFGRAGNGNNDPWPPHFFLGSSEVERALLSFALDHKFRIYYTL